MSITVIRYSDRPELWDDTEALSRAVWPEYNLHGPILGSYWNRLIDDFPEYQFVLFDDDQEDVLAEGHTLPCPWDGTPDGLGDGIDAMAELARAESLAHLLAPVRPSLKDRYPITPIERYVAWTRDNGEPFDPWIRVHTRRGGQIVKPIPQSLLITGTVGEWEQWTEMKFPESGEYTFPAGLAPVHIDREQDLGTYWEPNVWIVHPVG